MFTGLIEDLGVIVSVRKTGTGIRLALLGKADMEFKLGDSVSINGVCLTVSELGDNKAGLFFDVSPETLKNTNLGELKVNDRVNMERALSLSGRLGGHIVTGHVDGVGRIREKKQEGEYTFFTFDSTKEVLRYLVKKGSVAVDGISLTVIDITEGRFKVAIIPHTLSATTLGFKGVGDKVNLEADILGKYVEKFLSGRDSSSGLMDRLKEEGFV
ncbi:MAG: riboflavin synthase [Nitrospirae bacterium]|nr:riboflavin synthase [Nitrospirota bacterium]